MKGSVSDSVSMPVASLVVEKIAARPGLRMRRLGLIGLLLVAAAGGAWYVAGPHPTGAALYRTARVERGPLTASVSATGTLNAVITVQVGSQVSGQIKQLMADFNSTVKKGQLIARIDPQTFEAVVHQAQADVDNARAAVLNQEAALEKARADVENARASLAVAKANTAKAQVSVVDTQRNLGRQTDLLRRDLIAQSDKDSAQTAYDSAVAQLEANQAQDRAADSAVRSALAAARVVEAQLGAARATLRQKEAALAQAQIDLDHTYIRAPVDGVVVSRNVDIGQTVAASLQAPVLFMIAQDLTKMQVDTNVDEADVGRVRVGQRAAFGVDAFPGQTFEGEVNQIRKAPQILQNVVTYDVVIYVANPQQKLLPGMTANVRIITDSKPSVLKVSNATLRFRPQGTESEPEGGARGEPGTAGSARGGGDRTRVPPDHPAGDRGTAGRVWIVGTDGRLKPVPLRLGLTDGAATEILSGHVTEGTEVVVGPRAGSAPASTGGGPRIRL